MRRSLFPLALALFALGFETRGRAEEPKKAEKTVEELFPLYNIRGENWHHFSSPRTLESFYFGKYASTDPKAPPKYHVSLNFHRPEGAKAPVAPYHYGAAETVEATAGGGLRIVLAATKDVPRRELFLQLKDEKVELRIAEGPGKGTYAMERFPKLPDRKTVLAAYQEGWGDTTKKQALAEFRFYPYVGTDASGRPGLSYHITLKPTKDDAAEPQAYTGPALSAEEKEGTLKVTLPPAKKDGPKRVFLLKRDGDALVVTADGALKGEYKLEKLPPFNPRELFKTYHGDWADKSKEQALERFQFGTYDNFNGPPVARFHIGLIFRDREAGESYYGQAGSVVEDAKTGALKVTLPPLKEGGAKRELLVKRTGDVLEVTVADGKFKGTYKLDVILPKK